MSKNVIIKTVQDDIPLMVKTTKRMRKKKVNVGHLDGGENAWLAGIHEYGCDIKVTPKMRAYLHANGLHLKPSTTHIHIPERSFLRAGFDEHHEKVIKLCEKAFSQALTDGDDEAFFEAVGTLLRDKIIDYAIDLKEPPKHPWTIQQNPGKTNPLIVTGDMINALTYEVK